MDQYEHEQMHHSKTEQATMDHSKMDHAKMQHDHGAIPMGMPGHDHHKMMIQDFRKRFWISTLITIPILVFSPMIQDFFGYTLLLPGNSIFFLPFHPSFTFGEGGLS
ncbi:hypothetical protein [Parafilimonas sp.]|uniref:hypothetical protein n=1 Tax=Parafilimonas sp. TaxID=1969739 RepID=UPI003F7F3F3F